MLVGTGNCVRRETVAQGIVAAPAFLGLLPKARNFGKQLVAGMKPRAASRFPRGRRLCGGLARRLCLVRASCHRLAEYPAGE